MNHVTELVVKCCYIIGALVLWLGDEALLLLFVHGFRLVLLVGTFELVPCRPIHFLTPTRQTTLATERTPLTFKRMEATAPTVAAANQGRSAIAFMIENRFPILALGRR
jgi:hypothetical protein